MNFKKIIFCLSIFFCVPNYSVGSVYFPNNKYIPYQEVMGEDGTCLVTFPVVEYKIARIARGFLLACALIASYNTMSEFLKT